MISLLALYPVLSMGAWQYVLVDEQEHATYYSAPPVDLTYPPPGEAAQYLDTSKGEFNSGTVLTPEEEKARRSQGHLIIFDTNVLASERAPRPEYEETASDEYEDEESTTGGPSGHGGKAGHGGPVHVRGYYNKYGTYVGPYTRSYPSGGSHSSGGHGRR